MRAGVTVPRVAILGAGLMGRWHAHAARAVGAQVVAVADPDQVAARRVAGRAAAIHPGLEALLESHRPDVLHICSPSETHMQALSVALAHGVPVMVEKPLATTAAETRHLFGLAQQAGVPLCPVHQYAFQSCLAPLRTDPGRCGTLERVELVFHSAGAAGAAPGTWPVIAADILPHPLAILQRLWPEVALDEVDWTVTALRPGSWRLSAPLGPAHAAITISLAARPTQASLSLWGAAGAWEVDLFHGFSRFRDGTATRRSKALRPLADALGLFGHAAANLVGRAIRREAAYPGLRTLIAQFYGALRGQNALPIRPKDAIAVAEIRDRFLARTTGNSLQ